MILTGPEILKRVREGKIEIEPFREDQINPASYDLRLGKKVSRYTSERLAPRKNHAYPVDAQECNAPRPQTETVGTVDRRTRWVGSQIGTCAAVDRLARAVSKRPRKAPHCVASLVSCIGPERCSPPIASSSNAGTNPSRGAGCALVVSNAKGFGCQPDKHGKNESGLLIPDEKLDMLRYLDARVEPGVETLDLAQEGGSIMLHPGVLYLMHTEEIVCAHDCVSVIDGKSSLGRLGISCHQTAGYGDPGFRGQYTLEVTVVHPVVVYAGMRFCQIRFHEVVGEIQKYKGQYQGETAMGPVASRSWKQFENEEKK